jgi:hypothetical protein
MHQWLIKNLNHWFWIKFAKIVWFSKTRWSAKDKLDREALEGGGLFNLWFILLTSSTLLYVRLTFLHNQTRWATCFIHVLYRITGIARVDEVIHSTDPIFASVYELCVATCFIRVHSACRSCETRIYSIQTEGVRGWTLTMQRLNAWMPFL